jgi:diguanylate cyclase (GGDEF)-like protein
MDAATASTMERPETRSLSRRLPRLASIWLLTGALAMAALAIYQTLVPNGSVVLPGGPPWWLVVVLFAFAEIFVVHLKVRRDTHTFSLSEIPLVLGLFFLSPAELILTQSLGAGTALVLHRQQGPRKLFFNLAQFALGTSVAIVVFHAILGTGDPLGPPGWTASFAAAFAADVLGAVAVALAIALTAGERPQLPQLFGTGSLYTFADTSLALVGVIVVSKQPSAWWLLAVLASVVFLAYRIYQNERLKHESLEVLQESTRRIQQSLDADEVSRTLLDQTRQMFGADIAEVLFLPRDGESASLMRRGPGEAYSVEQVTLRPTEGVWARVAAEGVGVLVPRPPGDEWYSPDRIRLLVRDRIAGRGRALVNDRLHRHFAERGISDAMVAPLRLDDEIVGTMLVGNRRGNIGTWDDEHLTLFETLANHTSVTLQNGRLVRRLRGHAAANEHQATHDPLTDLPNRRLFRAHVADALAQAGTDGRTPLAVLMMDLDRFKDVNDTLGHATGDQLLQAVSRRLLATLGDALSVARLGGDEFAVLVRGGEAEGVAAAAALLDALEHPFTVHDLSLTVEAGIGIALAPVHGTDPDILMQHADVAMYQAKSSHSGSHVYRPDEDQYSPGRLALMGELRRAIERGELQVAYQPQLDVRSGHIEAAEALVRWPHQRLGMVPPSEFIPLTERTGLIRPLTQFMLRTAIAQCAAWRAAGHPMSVSVNLSARNLLDPALADEIDTMLALARLPAAALQVEITETSIMVDPVRTETFLAALHRIGVRVSVDDFGTGFSSFSYLKRLALDEIKIDRSFVVELESDGRDLQIVRSTIQLGHNLGLRVVAEGVETQPILDRLVELGCDSIQGFLIGRAVTAHELTDRLAAAVESARDAPLPPRRRRAARARLAVLPDATSDHVSRVRRPA